MRFLHKLISNDLEKLKSSDQSLFDMFITVCNFTCHLTYVTLEHKTSLKCKFFEIEIYASYKH